jgi:hypothetical protein
MHPDDSRGFDLPIRGEIARATLLIYFATTKTSVGGDKSFARCTNKIILVRSLDCSIFIAVFAIISKLLPLLLSQSVKCSVSDKQAEQNQQLRNHKVPRITESITPAAAEGG